jgi:predicted enzyme related to lactoylglutathione lyase
MIVPKGAFPVGQPVVHFEIGCKDAARTQKFFAEMFDWKLQPYGPAAMIDTGSQAGIQGHINSLGHEPHNYVTVYVQVDDLQAYLNKAGKLGGKTVVPATEVPGMGHFAWLADPEGNIIGIWKPAAQS